MKIINFALFLSTLSLLASCGGGGAGGGGSTKKPRQIYQESPLDSEITGQYLATLAPINPMLAENLRGAFTFSREGEEVIGDVRIANAFPEIVYGQNVREGSRCPTMEDDTNHDGFVDAIEGEAIYGKMLIPLDGDLGTQASMARVFPLADKYGHYIYAKATTFTSFMRDLREEDPSEEDDYVKLDKFERLALPGRVVVIHGVPKDFILPETVQTTQRQPKFQTMPIACGVIDRVTHTPGISDDSRPIRRAEEVSAEEIISL